LKKYLLFIFFTVIFINGCSFPTRIEKTFTKIQNSNFFRKKSNDIIVNFDSAIEEIIAEIFKSNNVFFVDKTLFFIDLVENRTNFFINTKKLTDLIKNKIAKTTKNINFLKTKIIEKNKKKLGITNIKNTLDVSTAILLCRNNHVKYYLRSSIYGQKEPFLLKMKLILVKTGEIVFMKEEKFLLEIRK